MLRITVWLLVGVFVWGLASCTIKCPDGHVCSDLSTCCLTKHGYNCCPYPNAVCCSDLSHCCPAGFSCNIATQMCEKQNQPWMSIPMVKKEDTEEPSNSVLKALQEPENSPVLDNPKSSVVYCDNYYICPDGTTCCRHPRGGWFCCGYSPGRCCLDGFHCCPYGYDCDYSYTSCVRQGLTYPFTPKQALSSVPASLRSTLRDKSSSQEQTQMAALAEASSSTHEVGVIRCDPKFYCPQGSSCCKGATGQWTCCPYSLGQCCADGRHCCEYGYSCDSTSLSCRRGLSQIPSGKQPRAKIDLGR